MLKAQRWQQPYCPQLCSGYHPLAVTESSEATPTPTPAPSPGSPALLGVEQVVHHKVLRKQRVHGPTAACVRLAVQNAARHCI